jgi:hypothetical protein
VHFSEAMPGTFRYRLLFVGVNAVPGGTGMNAPARDAVAMSERFRSWGLASSACNRLLTRQDATRERILAELGRITARPDLDLLLIYWAGHLTPGREPMLSTSGAEPGTCGEALGLDLLTSALAFPARARHRVLILDTCHAGDAAGPLDRTGEDVEDDECVAVFAAGCGEPSTRETPRRGHFTGALLEALPPGLRGAPPKTDLLRAWRYASDVHAVRWADRPVVGVYGTGEPLILPDRRDSNGRRLSKPPARVLTMPSPPRAAERPTAERRRA